jgi:CDGSH iron-sulfur domain-containing protein 3
MATPHIAKKGPYVIEEKAGKKAWCQCGLSKRQPYCDGSHKDTGVSPIVVTIEGPGRVAWCGCKRSGQKPFCDGSHNKL